MEKDYEAGDSAQRRTGLFNRYVLPHRNLIYKLCVKYSRSASEVEDNYSEALANFFKYIETYDPARSIQPWLHTVTKRFVCEMNRRNRALLKRSDDVDVSQMPDMTAETETGESGLDMDNYRSLYSDDVLEALSRLKPIYREALLLQQAGYRLNEIMEISCRNGNLKTRNIETVKSRLFLAKQQMRRLIDRNGERRKD
jgi:RNA polymerase sigma factor (sigma-70 family)